MLTSMESAAHTQDLATYIGSLPRGGVSDLAARLGISRVYLSQLAARESGRQPSPELCVAIERESGRAVRRWAMRERDWHLIWPELIATEGAPPVPNTINTEVRDAA